MDALAIIDRTIAEHREIRRQVQHAGDAVPDIAALFVLQQARSAWSQSSDQELAGKRSHLQQVIGQLEEGLKNHFDFEEKYLPPVFGEYLMKALLSEHRGISGQINQVKDMLASLRPEGAGEPWLLQKKEELQQTVYNLCQTIEEHAGHEEIILNMIKRGLEGEAARK